MTRSVLRLLNFLMSLFRNQDNFKMDMHVNFVVSQCNQKLYLLKLLHCQGLSTAQLDQVSHSALIVSRLDMICTPCLVGVLTVNLINKIQSTLKRLYRFGYTAQLISTKDILKSCSVDLFHNPTTASTNYCLLTLSVLIACMYVNMILCYLYVPVICISKRL